MTPQGPPDIAGLPPLTRRQVAGDLLLVGVCLAVAVAIQVTGTDAIAANLRPDLWSVLLTIAAIAPLAFRRRAPLLVLIACFPGFIGLVALQYSVGAAPLGIIIGFYTAVAWDSRRNAHRALGVLVIGLVIVTVLGPIDLSVEGAVVQIALFVGGWVIGNGTRERREHQVSRVVAAELKAEIATERAAMERERATHAAAEERLRIVRDLHDILGHSFSVMVVQAGVAERLLDTAPEQARQAVTEIAETGRESLAEMRRLLGVLRTDETKPPREPTPALADLPALVARIRAAGLDVHLDTHHLPIGLSPGIELAAYRIVQESLTNCLKHAAASSARVRVDVTDDQLVVEVTDDGHGPEGNEGPDSTGHGLNGMQERVAFYGGRLTAGPVAPGGYRVHAEVPMAAGQPADAR
jgi:signal transduction histidine kinase